MRKINAKVALITGLPLGTMIALFEDNLRGGSSWLILGRQALLCAAILGIPQGYLAALPLWRRGRAWLLPAMVMTGVVLMNVAGNAAPFLLRVLPGGWGPLPNPPARAIDLVGLKCTNDYPYPLTLWVETADRSIYRFDAPVYPFDQKAKWTPFKGAPTSEPGFCAPAPSGLTSRLVTHQGVGNCGQDLEVVLGDDGQIWQRARTNAGLGNCANSLEQSILWIIVYPFLSVVLSAVAWVAVVFEQRPPASTSAGIGVSG